MIKFVAAFVLALAGTSVNAQTTAPARDGLVLTVGRLSAGHSLGRVVISLENKTTRAFDTAEVECGFYLNGQLIGADSTYLRNLTPGTLAHGEVTASNSRDADSVKCRIISQR